MTDDTRYRGSARAYNRTEFIGDRVAAASVCRRPPLDQRNIFSIFSAAGQGSRRLPDFILSSAHMASSTVSSWFSTMAHSRAASSRCPSSCARVNRCRSPGHRLETATTGYSLPSSVRALAVKPENPRFSSSTAMTSKPSPSRVSVRSATHGFALLHRTRSYLPELQSVLMDEDTLLRHTALWVDENEQHPAAELTLLTEAEQRLYRNLKQQRWGQNVRLEQERVDWDTAWHALQRLIF